MIQAFAYHAPHSLDEALDLLAEHGSEARVLAGGTDLLIQFRTGHSKPTHVINIKRIEELRQMESTQDFTYIGALATLTDLLALESEYAALGEAVRTMAGVQIRNMATVGGNLCNASPAADLAPPLMVLDATVEIARRGGRRAVALADFFAGPGRTVMEPDEMLVSVGIPRAAANQSCTFLKMARRGAMEIAIASVAVAVKRSNGICNEARISMGAVAPTPLRAVQAEEALRDAPLDAEHIQKAAQLAATEARPIDDGRAPAWYRNDMIEVMTRRALDRLAKRTHS